MVDATQHERPESQLDYVLRTGNVLFYRRRAELEKLSGVPKSTINKIMDRTRKNSRSTTIQAIYDVLKQEEEKLAAAKAAEKPVIRKSKA